MTQFQVEKSNIANTRIAGEPSNGSALADGEIAVRVERFGLSANNITYAVAGDTLNYWKFFPTVDDAENKWGIFPVWGFAEVVSSTVDGLTPGERLFGYFPPADTCTMKVSGLSDTLFFDSSEHRLALPKGYNMYRRVAAEPGYTRAGDDLRMLLYPLYLTSFALWDQLHEFDWYGAEQVIIISASSKTSIGLGYALADDKTAPPTVGLTSAGNRSFVETTQIYRSVATYDSLENDVANIPTAIVDMSGNAQVLGRLHAHLGHNMKHTLDVGLTHWESARKDANIIRDRREFFFAPSRIQKRMQDWGAEEFGKRSTNFVTQTAMQSTSWLKLETLQGLQGLSDIYGDVLNGTMAPERGLLIEM